MLVHCVRTALHVMMYAFVLAGQQRRIMTLGDMHNLAHTKHANGCLVLVTARRFGTLTPLGHP